MTTTTPLQITRIPWQPKGTRYQPPMATPPIQPQRGMTYEGFADKVGLVPNIRMKDNLYQGMVVAGFMILGITLGGIRWGWSNGVVPGALVGLVSGGLLSGSVLMIIGLLRRN